MLIDLHTHTLFSDGVLIPSEQVQRVRQKEYAVLGITDHADYSNYEYILESLWAARKSLNAYPDLKVFIGIEITHVPPRKIEGLVLKAREKGAQIIVGHGESIIEPVEPSSNEAFIKSGVDILAHPGFITPELARLAADRKVFLELSYRRGHCLTNGFVAKLALETGAPLCLDSDSHAPGDFFANERAYDQLALGSGLSLSQLKDLKQNLESFVASLAI